MESLCRLGIGLALCLAWVTFGTPAQGDAHKREPVSRLSLPSGWRSQKYLRTVVSVLLILRTKIASCIIITHMLLTLPQKETNHRCVARLIQSVIQ